MAHCMPEWEAACAGAGVELHRCCLVHQDGCTVSLRDQLQPQHSDGLTVFACGEIRSSTHYACLSSSQAPIFTKLLGTVIFDISIALSLAESCQQSPKLLWRNCHTAQMCKTASLESWDNKIWWVGSESQEADPRNLKKLGWDQKKKSWDLQWDATCRKQIFIWPFHFPSSMQG